MKVLRYPFRSLIGDYLRTLSGLGIGVIALAAGPTNNITLFIFTGITVLFAFFGLRTLQRTLAQVALSNEGVALRDIRTRKIYWRDLEQVKLRFYGTRRRSAQDRNSFLQLTLAGAGTSFTLESSLEDFTLLGY